MIDEEDDPLFHWFAGLVLTTLLTAILFNLPGCLPDVRPIVPTPDPITPPVIVVPVPSGDERIVLVLHESHDQTPALARLKTELQGGQAAAYFISKHHSVFVLDINAKDENNQPLSAITRLRPTIGTTTLPVLIVATKANDGRLGNVLLCESLQPDTTANDIVSLVKKKGG